MRWKPRTPASLRYCPISRPPGPLNLHATSHRRRISSNLRAASPHNMRSALSLQGAYAALATQRPEDTLRAVRTALRRQERVRRHRIHRFNIGGQPLTKPGSSCCRRSFSASVTIWSFAPCARRCSTSDLPQVELANIIPGYALLPKARNRPNRADNRNTPYSDSRVGETPVYQYRCSGYSSPALA